MFTIAVVRGEHALSGAALTTRYLHRHPELAAAIEGHPTFQRVHRSQTQTYSCGNLPLGFVGGAPLQRCRCAIPKK